MLFGRGPIPFIVTQVFSDIEWVVQFVWNGLSGVHFTTKSQRARAPDAPSTAAAGPSCAGSASKRARFATAAGEAETAARRDDNGGGFPCFSFSFLCRRCSVLLIAWKGKNNPAPLSLSLSRHSSIRRRSEICIWEKVLLLHTNARALTRHRACICLSRIYGDSCLCGRREREGRKEEESANSIRGGIQKMPREDLGAAEPAPTVSASRAAACDSSPTP